MVQVDFDGVAQINFTHNGVEQQIPVNLVGVTESWAQTKDLDFGQPGRMKYIDYILFDCETDGDVELLSVQLGVRDKILKDDSNIVWTNLGYLDFSNPIVSVRLEARYFTLLLTDESPIAPWTISRIEFYGEFTGFGRW